MSKVIFAAAAAALIKDGATLGAACVMSGWPEEIAITMEKRFLSTGHLEENSRS